VEGSLFFDRKEHEPSGTACHTRETGEEGYRDRVSQEEGRDEPRFLIIAQDCGNGKGGVKTDPARRVEPYLYWGVMTRCESGEDGVYILSANFRRSSVFFTRSLLRRSISSPHWLTQHAVVNYSINNVGLHIQSSLSSLNLNINFICFIFCFRSGFRNGFPIRGNSNFIFIPI